MNMQPSATTQGQGPAEIDDENMSVQSDQITICSPQNPSPQITAAGLEPASLKQQKRREIKRGLHNRTSDLEQLNRVQPAQKSN